MKVGENGWSRNGQMPALKRNWCPFCGSYKGWNHTEEHLKLNLPLVRYYEDGVRTGYLINVLGEAGKVVVQPIGPKGTVPQKITLKIDQVQMVNGYGEVIPEPVSLPADAGAAEVEVQLEKQRSIIMADKAKKTTSKKEAKPASVKYLVLTDKAPETKELKEGSHAYAVVAGLRKLSTGGVQGKATRERLMEAISANKLIKTDMDVSKAISWMIGQLVGKGAIKRVSEAA